MDRRSFLTSSAVVAAGAAAGTAGGLAIPGGAAWAERTNGPGRNGVSKARPKRGGSLTFGTTAEEQGFNASSARFDSVGVMYARTVFDPLAIIDAAGSWAPYLAASITPTTDYTAWTITLRPTVVFHDGTPCDGAALLLNLQTYHTAFLTGIALKPVVQAISQTGPLSVQISFKYPWVSFPYYLAGGVGSQLAWVMAPAMINAKTGGTDNPIGTGPFKFTRWVPNTHFTATRWDRYWRKGLPYLDRITYKPIVDYTSRADALESGTIDMMVTDVPQNIVVYRGDRQWSYVDDSGPVIGEPTMNCLLLNVSTPPFDTASVRLAAARAVTRAAYARVVDLGVNPVSTGLFAKGSPYYAKTSLPTYDPSHARELLRRVAGKTGKPVAFQLGSTNSAAAERAATYVQQRYEQVGFKVTKVVVQQNEFINNALKGDFQAYVWRQFGAVNPDLNYIFWSTTTITKALSINMARNDDPRVQSQLLVGRSSATARARAGAYKKINEYFAQDLPYLWADRTVWAVVAHPDVQNFNNPTTPSGGRAYGFIGGSIWPTQIWRS